MLFQLFVFSPYGINTSLFTVRIGYEFYTCPIRYREDGLGGRTVGASCRVSECCNKLFGKASLSDF